MANEHARQSSLTVLGIDPGLADVGWGVVRHEPPRAAALLEYGVIRTVPADPLPERLYQIYQAVARLIERHRPAVMSIEALFFAKNARTAMGVAHGRAAAILAAGAAGVAVVEYTPLQLKQALTGSGKAGKAQVQSMVKAVLGLGEIPRPDHAADALAAALCHCQSQGLRAKLEAMARRGHGAGARLLEEATARLPAMEPRRSAPRGQQIETALSQGKAAAHEADSRNVSAGEASARAERKALLMQSRGRRRK